MFFFHEEVPKWHLTYSGVCEWYQLQQLLLYLPFSFIPDSKLALPSPLCPWMVLSLPSGCQGDWVSLMQMLSLAPCHPSPGDRAEFSLSLAQ